MHPAGRNNPCGAKEQDKVADLDERRWYVEKQQKTVGRVMFLYIRQKAGYISGRFRPEYAGQLNFYLSAVDGILKKTQDNPSIGLLLCKSKNNLVPEYSLKDISKPIGVSEYKVTSSLPDDLEKQLPSVEDIQKRIRKKYVNAGIMILYLTKVKFTEKGDSNDATDNCTG